MPVDQLDSDAIIEAALRLGSTAAGVVRADRLLDSPSFRSAGLRPRLETGSLVVMALAHPPEDARMDSWDGEGGTPGNRALGRIAELLAAEIRDAGCPEVEVLPYQPSRGGVFLKDAAVLAGLGVIGRNNLLVTPGWGPRVRLRCLRVGAAIGESKRISFDPCSGCDEECARNCPEGALDGGGYSRERCRVRMNRDEAQAEREPDGSARIFYCRQCEKSCPAGSTGV